MVRDLEVQTNQIYMSVYKEIGYAAKTIEEKSVRIFEDACDYGFPVTSLEDPIFKLIKEQILPYCDGEVETHNYSTGSTQTMKFNGGYPAVIEAGFEKLTLTYTTIRKHPKGYIGFVTVNVETSEKAKQQAREYDN